MIAPSPMLRASYRIHLYDRAGLTPRPSEGWCHWGLSHTLVLELNAQCTRPHSAISVETEQSAACCMNDQAEDAIAGLENSQLGDEVRAAVVQVLWRFPRRPAH